jgi:hypothetical protein
MTTTKSGLAHFYYSVSAPSRYLDHDEECARSLLPPQCASSSRHQAPDKTLLLHSSNWLRQWKQRARLLASAIHAPYPRPSLYSSGGSLYRLAAQFSSAYSSHTSISDGLGQRSTCLPGHHPLMTYSTDTKDSESL